MGDKSTQKKDETQPDIFDFFQKEMVLGETFSPNEDVKVFLTEFFQKRHNYFPACKTFYIRKYNRKAFYESIKNDFKISLLAFPDAFRGESSSLVILKHKDGEFYYCFDTNDESFHCFVMFNKHNDEHIKMMKEIPKFEIKVEGNNKVCLLIREYGEYRLEPFPVREQKLDFDNYNNDFEAVHEKIIKFLADDDERQLCLLHGTYGTGKSRYLRALTAYTDKPIIYVTSDIINEFCSPDFISFATEKLKNSVIIIEDGDEVIVDNNTRGKATSNILNLSSGCLSDILNTKIILTFNVDESRLDKALLRKGRLRIKYEMKALTPDRANNLLKKLGKAFRTDKEMTVAEIYGIDEDNGASTEQKKIGF